MAELRPIQITSPRIAGHDGFRSTFPIWVAAFVATMFITLASYPGFLSYDSIQELMQARTAVDGSQYPPFGSYVWRIFDWIAPGPTLMQFVQNGLLEFSFAYIVGRTRLPKSIKVLCVAAFTVLPPILGTMLVVWKDVAVGACYMGALALVISVTTEATRNQRYVRIAMALFLVWCGMAYRFNAASGAFPLVMYAVWKLLGPCDKKHQKLKRIMGCAMLTLALSAVVWMINNYRLPSFERLARNTNSDSIMKYDLIGISIFSNKAIVPDVNGHPLSADYLRKIYDPRHLNITANNDHEHRVAPKLENVTSLWISAIMANPVAYLQHRTAVFREYISLHRHDVFYVTHPSVDANSLGITFTATPFKSYVTEYLWRSRSADICRPWIYYLTSLILVAALFMVKASSYRFEALTAFSSGYLYLMPMYFITPAADLRYNFWSVCGCVVASILALAGICMRDRDDGQRKKKVDNASTINTGAWK
ncbi:hypothetical protein LMG9964_04173 [Paraburkholderia phenoliruptrix]|nr:hypothetical protein LMG9964_04173 [Paraburkholderia phenoliruptrix]